MRGAGRRHGVDYTDVAYNLSRKRTQVCGLIEWLDTNHPRL
jgi:hypothetical protein